MEKITKEILIDKISKWEYEVGESFTDRFMHDNVRDVSWAFWLIGKGFKERGNIIINLVDRGETCLDQSLLYEIHYSKIIDGEYGDHGEEAYKKSREYAEEMYDKDIELWAEFLTSSDVYLERITKWFNEEDN